MPQYRPEIAAFYAEKHLTLAERNEAYAAAVRFANDRGESHKNFLTGEEASRVTAKGIYVPIIEDRVLPMHCDPANVEIIQEEHPGCDPFDLCCDGSRTKTTTGECRLCGRVFCTDTDLPMMAELEGEEECSCEGHCEDCRVAKGARYFTAIDAVLCPEHLAAREAPGLSMTDADA